MKTELPDLYKQIVRQLRVVRNVSKSHKEALNSDSIVYDAMTPYERGRMGRACKKLGDDLYELYLEHGQTKMVFYFHGFVEALGVSGSMFCKPGAGQWTTLYRICHKAMDTEINFSNITDMMSHVGNMLDEPLAKVPSRVTLMKLAVL